MAVGLDRLKDAIAPLAGRNVLDVGCGSGYHCWRMRGAGANLVVGIDPTPLFVMQYFALQKYLCDNSVAVLPMGIEHLPEKLQAFDTTFSMGILYHRRSPFDHLIALGNVWFIPTTDTLEAWLKKAGFKSPQLIDVSQTTCEEQRSTEWMTFHSLAEFLNPEDSNQTIEGYPAPRRATFIAEKP